MEASNAAVGLDSFVIAPLGGFIAYLAVQFGLGLLSERWIGCCLGYRARSRFSKSQTTSDLADASGQTCRIDVAYDREAGRVSRGTRPPDQSRAHAMAEQAAVKLHDAGVPGEYFVVASVNVPILIKL